MTALYVWDNDHLRKSDQGCSDNDNIEAPQQIHQLDDAEIQSISSGQNHSLVCIREGPVYSCTHDLQKCGSENIITMLDCVKGLHAKTVIQVAAGFSHSVVLTKTNKVYTWGQNDEGQLGRDAPNRKGRKSPRIVMTLTDHCVIQISCGHNHTLALTNDGLVYAWGSNNYGQLGLGESTNPHKGLPELVSCLIGIPVQQITAGGNHSFLLSKSGGVYSWGRNDLGQLGLSHTDKSYWPKKNRHLNDQHVKYISCGEDHTACLTKDGRVFTFGAGSHGQLGHCSSDDVNAPKQVMELSGSEVSQIACGSHCTLAYVPTSGRLYVFGLQRSEQCELPNSVTSENSLSSSGSFVLSSGPHSSHFSIQLGNEKPEFKIKSIYAGGNRSFVSVVSGSVFNPDDFRKENPESQILTLSAERIKIMLNSLNSAETSSIDKFCPEIEKIFSNAACLNGSFLLLNDKHFGSGRNNHGVNMDAVREFFKDLAKAPKLMQCISTNIEKNLIPLLPTSPPDTEALRLYLIIPECNIFDQPELYSSIICQFAQKFINLDNVALKLFDIWWPSNQPSFFKRLVVTYKQCVQYLMQLPYSANSPEDIKRNKDLLISVQMLEKLYKVNEANNIIDGTTFIVPDLKDKINIQVAYLLHWTAQLQGKPLPGLNFCDYPFLLDTETKSILFQTDAIFYASTAAVQNFHNPFAINFLLSIRRQCIVDDTFSILRTADIHNFKKSLVVHFEEENAGGDGVKKEFFRLLFREVMDPEFGLFTTDEKSMLQWFNSSTEQESEKFRIIGILCGLVIYNSIPIDLHFPLALYKKLLKKTVTFDDLSELMPGVGKNLKQVLDFDEEGNIFELTFVAGAIVNESTELCPGGETQEVNQSNKQEYVDLCVDYHLNKSVRFQFDAFCEGFQSVRRGKILDYFRPEELQSLVQGHEDYDFSELEKNTTYQGGYSRNHQTITFFWEVFNEINLADKKKFLLFVTGSDRIPITGMKDITMEIQPSNEGEAFLPAAWTCFNRLLLPKYTTKEQLKSKLIMAIQKTEGFLLEE